MDDIESFLTNQEHFPFVEGGRNIRASLPTLSDVEKPMVHAESVEVWKLKSEGSTKRRASRQRSRELRLGFIADARQHGIELTQKGGARSFLTPSGKVVGITYSSEGKRSNYWLGLPDEDYHALVLFCESTSRSKLRRFILPRLLFRKYVNNWSRPENGDYQFNIFEREAGKYVLQIPGRADEDISKYHDAFEFLKG